MSICEDFHVTVLSGVPERKCSRLVCCLDQICDYFFCCFHIMLFHCDKILDTLIRDMTGFADHRFCSELGLVV